MIPRHCRVGDLTSNSGQVNPAFVMIMSIWYTSDEQPLRLEAYYCTNGLATIFGGLIGYAVGHITTGLPRWQYVFLIFGSISLASGVVSLFILPDVPATARFLNPKERTIATDRVSHCFVHQVLGFACLARLTVVVLGSQKPDWRQESSLQEGSGNTMCQGSQ